MKHDLLYANSIIQATLFKPKHKTSYGQDFKTYDYVKVKVELQIDPLGDKKNIKEQISKDKW